MNYDQLQNNQNPVFFTAVSGGESVNPDSDNPQPGESINTNVFTENSERDFRALGGVATSGRYPSSSEKNNSEQLGQIIPLEVQGGEEPTASQTLNPSLISETPSGNLEKLMPEVEKKVDQFLKNPNNNPSDFYQNFLEERRLAA